MKKVLKICQICLDLHHLQCNFFKNSPVPLEKSRALRALDFDSLRSAMAFSGFFAKACWEDCYHSLCLFWGFRAELQQKRLPVNYLSLNYIHFHKFPMSNWPSQRLNNYHMLLSKWRVLCPRDRWGLLFESQVQGTNVIPLERNLPWISSHTYIITFLWRWSVWQNNCNNVQICN